MLNLEVLISEKCSSKKCILEREMYWLFYFVLLDPVALVDRKLGQSEKRGRDIWGEESRIKAKGKGRFVDLFYVQISAHGFLD